MIYLPGITVNLVLACLLLNNRTWKRKVLRNTCSIIHRAELYLIQKTLDMVLKKAKLYTGAGFGGDSIRARVTV